MNIIIIVSFDYGASDKFGLLHEVLLKSIKRNISNVKVISHHLPEPEIKYNRTRSFISNSIKLEKWVETIRKCKDGDRIILMDADMLVLHDSFEVFNEDFDIGYTARTNSKWPLNGGIIFIKANKRSIDFMNILLAVNNFMLKDPQFHKKWQEKYAGINQAALGSLLEHPECYSAKLRDFPCKIYNACGDDLPSFDKDITKILHIKGGLRKAIFGEIKTEPVLAIPVSLWNEYRNL